MDFDKCETHDGGKMAIYCLPTHSAYYKVDFSPWLVPALNQAGCFFMDAACFTQTIMAQRARDVKK